MLKDYALYIAILYSIGLATLSIVNLSELPEIEVESGDKLFHCLSYFVLVCVWYNVLINGNKTKNRAIGMAVVLAFVFGIIIELLQSVITKTRTADIYDVMANAFGILLAIFTLVIYNTKHVKNR